METRAKFTEKTWFYNQIHKKSAMFYLFLLEKVEEIGVITYCHGIEKHQRRW